MKSRRQRIGDACALTTGIACTWVLLSGFSGTVPGPLVPVGILLVAIAAAWLFRAPVFRPGRLFFALFTVELAILSGGIAGHSWPEVALLALGGWRLVAALSAGIGHGVYALSVSLSRTLVLGFVGMLVLPLVLAVASLVAGFEGGAAALLPDRLSGPALQLERMASAALEAAVLAVAAVFTGMPTGFVTAGLGRGRMAVLVALGLVAFCPLVFLSSTPPGGLALPVELPVFFAAAAWVALAAIRSAGQLPASLVAAARLSGARRRDVLARILLPLYARPIVFSFLLAWLVVWCNLPGPAGLIGQALSVADRSGAALLALCQLLPAFAIFVYLLGFVTVPSGIARPGTDQQEVAANVRDSR